MKVFLGIETASAQGELASAANYLAAITGGHAVSSGNLHVTIKYLGNVNSVNTISRVTEAMDRACRRQRSFYLKVDCAASIPGKDRVCALLDGDIKEYEEFKANVLREVAAKIPKTNKLPYMPHVTLAFGVKKRWEDEDVRLQKIPFLVSRLTLYESVMQNGEVFFIPLYTSEFRG